MRKDTAQYLTEIKVEFWSKAIFIASFPSAKQRLNINLKSTMNDCSRRQISEPQAK